jgi:hypothetical protein
MTLESLNEIHRACHIVADSKYALAEILLDCRATDSIAWVMGEHSVQMILCLARWSIAHLFTSRS